MVTQTAAYGPSGAEHVEGSLNETCTAPIPDVVPTDLRVVHATTTSVTTRRQLRARKGCQIFFDSDFLHSSDCICFLQKMDFSCIGEEPRRAAITAGWLIGTLQLKCAFLSILDEVYVARHAAV